MWQEEEEEGGERREGEGRREEEEERGGEQRNEGKGKRGTWRRETRVSCETEDGRTSTVNVLLPAHSLHSSHTPPLTLPLPMCLARWHIESSEREFLSVGKENGREGRERERGRVSLEERAEKRTLEDDTYCEGSPQDLLHCSTGGENSNVTVHGPHTTTCKQHTMSVTNISHTHLHN